MLFTYAAPEDVIISKALPLPVDLGSTTEGCCVEIAEDFERNLAGKDEEWVYADQIAELL